MTKETKATQLDMLKESKSRHFLSFKKTQEELEKMLQEKKEDPKIAITQLEEELTDLKQVYEEMFYILDRIPDDKNIEAFSATLWDEREEVENHFIRLIATRAIELNIWNLRTRSWEKPRDPPINTPPRRSQVNWLANPRTTVPQIQEPLIRHLEQPKLVPQQFNDYISKRTSLRETKRAPQVNTPIGPSTTSSRNQETTDWSKVTELVAQQMHKRILQPFNGGSSKGTSFQESFVYNQSEEKVEDTLATNFENEKGQAEHTELCLISTATQIMEFNGKQIRSNPLSRTPQVNSPRGFRSFSPPRHESTDKSTETERVIRQTSFGKSFRRADYNQNLQNIDKLNQLKMPLIEDVGQEREELYLTIASYADAIYTLKENCGKSNIVESVINQFYKPREDLNSKNTRPLRSIRNELKIILKLDEDANRSVTNQEANINVAHQQSRIYRKTIEKGETDNVRENLDEATNYQELKKRLAGTVTDVRAPDQNTGDPEGKGKVLELVSNVGDDHITFDTRSCTDIQENIQIRCMKRNTLALSSRRYDPIGLSPIIFVSKILHHEKRQTDWNGMTHPHPT
jgi:Protein of unknown function (DUF1759)